MINRILHTKCVIYYSQLSDVTKLIIIIVIFRMNLIVLYFSTQIIAFYKRNSTANKSK